MAENLIFTSFLQQAKKRFWVKKMVKFFRLAPKKIKIKGNSITGKRFTKTGLFWIHGHWAAVVKFGLLVSGSSTGS
jgi:hypothetical protein